jgi:hypothetical protein
MLFGLSEVSTEDLKKAYRLLIHNELKCPLTPVELARTGLQHRQEDFLNLLRGLDAPAVQAVLTAVLSERARSHL